MVKRIEIRDKTTNYLIATYHWDTMVFSYDGGFFALHGDWLMLTNGVGSKSFESLPDYFFEFLPAIGSANFNRITKQYGVDPNDTFRYITRFSQNLPASYYLKGVEE